MRQRGLSLGEEDGLEEKTAYFSSEMSDLAKIARVTASSGFIIDSLAGADTLVETRSSSRLSSTDDSVRLALYLGGEGNIVARGKPDDVRPVAVPLIMSSPSQCIQGLHRPYSIESICAARKRKKEVLAQAASALLTNSHDSDRSSTDEKRLTVENVSAETKHDLSPAHSYQRSPDRSTLDDCVSQAFSDEDLTTSLVYTPIEQFDTKLMTNTNREETLLSKNNTPVLSDHSSEISLSVDKPIFSVDIEYSQDTSATAKLPSHLTPNHIQNEDLAPTTAQQSEDLSPSLISLLAKQDTHFEDQFQSTVQTPYLPPALDSSAERNLSPLHTTERKHFQESTDKASKELRLAETLSPLIDTSTDKASKREVCHTETLSPVMNIPADKASKTEVRHAETLSPLIDTPQSTTVIHIAVDSAEGSSSALEQGGQESATSSHDRSQDECVDALSPDDQSLADSPVLGESAPSSEDGALPSSRSDAIVKKALLLEDLAVLSEEEEVPSSNDDALAQEKLAASSEDKGALKSSCNELYTQIPVPQDRGGTGLNEQGPSSRDDFIAKEAAVPKDARALSEQGPSCGDDFVAESPVQEEAAAFREAIPRSRDAAETFCVDDALLFTSSPQQEAVPNGVLLPRQTLEELARIDSLDAETPSIKKRARRRKSESVHKADTRIKEHSIQQRRYSEPSRASHMKGWSPPGVGGTVHAGDSSVPKRAAWWKSAHSRREDPRSEDSMNIKLQYKARIPPTQKKKARPKRSPVLSLTKDQIKIDEYIAYAMTTARREAVRPPHRRRVPPRSMSNELRHWCIAAASPEEDASRWRLLRCGSLEAVEIADSRNFAASLLMSSYTSIHLTKEDLTPQKDSLLVALSIGDDSFDDDLFDSKEDATTYRIDPVALLRQATSLRESRLVYLGLTNLRLDDGSPDAPQRLSIALTSLSHLRALDLSFNHLRRAPKSLPVSLRELALNNNRIRNATFLEHLADLQCLDLSHNYLRSVAALHPLVLARTSLQEIRIHGNDLCHLSPNWRAALRDLLPRAALL